MDYFIFYMGVGLVINWLVALFALYVDNEGFVEVDAMNFFLTIPVWPITLYNIICSFFERN